jgi:hypothetical protein
LKKSQNNAKNSLLQFAQYNATSVKA